MIFFVRDAVFQKTFDAVRAVKPRRLFLWQDGPRKDHLDDAEGIRRCREVVENIDWDCEVYRQYNEKNIGCDPSIYYAYKWAFTHVDKCIFLEDDQVACPSFFRFCGEMLERYENDTRISHICGMNYTEVTESCPDDYLFAPFGSGAWATWKRIADEWDSSYSFLDDATSIAFAIKHFGRFATDSFAKARERRKTGKEFWESIVGCNCLLNDHLVIIPKKNLVVNDGMTANSTHGSADLRHLPKVTRKLFVMKAYEMAFPLRHPAHVVMNTDYLDQVTKIMALGHPLLKLKRHAEGYINRHILYREHY